MVYPKHILKRAINKVEPQFMILKQKLADAANDFICTCLLCPSKR